MMCALKIFGTLLGGLVGIGGFIVVGVWLAEKIDRKYGAERGTLFVLVYVMCGIGIPASVWLCNNGGLS